MGPDPIRRAITEQLGVRHIPDLVSSSPADIVEFRHAHPSPELREATAASWEIDFGSQEDEHPRTTLGADA